MISLIKYYSNENACGYSHCRCNEHASFLILDNAEYVLTAFVFTKYIAKNQTITYVVHFGILLCGITGIGFTSRMAA